jgi:GTPase SAR1 family protein
VTYEEAENFAKSNNFNYYEVSALTGEKVADAFQHMSEVVLQKIAKKELNTDG